MIPDLYAEGKPLLLGILLDVSASMRESWKNRDGRSLPRIQVVQKTLHDRLQYFQAQNTDDEKGPQADLFALGFGFRNVIPHVGIGGSSLQTTVLRNDVICDLLALAELVPNQAKLDAFQATLDTKWKQCAGSVFENATIKEDVFEETRDFIQTNMYFTAQARLRPAKYQAGIWPLWLRIYGRVSHEQRKQRIETTSKTGAQRFVENLKSKVDDEFQKSRATYILIIRETLQKFVKSFVETTLQSIVLGFPIPEIVETLNEKEANALALDIYRQLESTIGFPMKISIKANQELLFDKVRRLHAKLDKQEIKELSERFVKKYFWDGLYPLIQKEIREMFEREFQEQLRGSLYRWVELAAAREISRPLHQISSLLPDTVDEELYSERVMFGSTPFRKALDLAGARMIDPRYAHHQKVLLVISDGVFDEDSSIMVVAEMLKKRGVRIISGMIHPQNFLQKMFPCGIDHWPEGARKMLAIASDIPEKQTKDKKSVLEKIQAPQKFFYHINSSQVLEELINTLFVEEGLIANP
jgi:hypothetical protein